jgi:hypothetical protein
MIADSRATWLVRDTSLLQDSLQKILPLGERTGIAFTGDVNAAELIVRKLRQRIAKKPKLHILTKLAAELPRIARYYYRVHEARTGRRESLIFILGGVTASGVVEIWSFESPRFNNLRLTERFLVAGTGSVVAPYIQKNIELLDQKHGDLKTCADALLLGLEEELRRKGVDTVGGMLQVLLLDSGGIRPMRRGFVTLDPEGPVQARMMEMKAGRWIQRDLGRGLEIPLMEPAGLLRTTPKELRVYDFELPDSNSSIPKWHLTYFVTCLAVQMDVGTIEFQNVLTSVATVQYPVSFKILGAIGLWGTPGDHELTFSLVRDGSCVVVHRQSLHIEYLPEELNHVAEITLNIDAPGPAFLECQIATQTLGRRALYFSRVPKSAAVSEAAFVASARQNSQLLLEEQRACLDLMLEESGRSTLVYFSVCHSGVDEDALLRFEGQMMAVFWKSYPLKLRLFIASAFRMPQGEHRLRVDLVNAATREVSPVATITTTSTSSCIVVPVHGELIAIVPGPGIYFVNAYVDVLRLPQVCRSATNSPQPSVRR